jgi:hypothetical protein
LDGISGGYDAGYYILKPLPKVGCQGPNPRNKYTYSKYTGSLKNARGVNYVLRLDLGFAIWDLGFGIRDLVTIAIQIGIWDRDLRFLPAAPFAFAESLLSMCPDHINY